MGDLTPERWQRIEAIFEQAGALDETERLELLERIGREDPGLRSEVDALLRVHAQAGDIMERPVDIAMTGDDDLIGRQVGAYRVVERIGAGGMGAVYAAHRADEAFEKTVAIKVIKRGMDSEEILERFRRERRVLAGLEHPNIARLLDAGLTEDGRSYLVMECVGGVPIDRYCDEASLPVRERLRLFEQVCAAVQYAHQNLVVHRDLKPANIVVTTDGTVKLLDFGIAKVLGATDGMREPTLTGDASRPMTPRYASPEQVRGEPITTATDVYALGVLLYELLTGEAPHRFDSGTREEIHRVVCDESPSRPSTRVTGVGDEAGAVARRRTTAVALMRTLRGDLDWITLRAMEKDPARRYASASELSAEIDRYLANEPVVAGPPGSVYRFRKFVRRHRVGVAAATTTFTAIVTALVVSVVMYLQADAAKIAAQESEDEAIAQRERAETETAIAKAVNAFLNEDLLAQADPFAEPDRDITLRAVVDRAAEKIDERFDEQPLVAASLRVTLANTYQGLAEFEAATTHLEEALRLQRAELGPRDENTLATAGELAGVMLQRGELDRAEAMLDELLVAGLPDEHPTHMTARNDLALVYDAQGRYDESVELLVETLEIQRRILGDDHVNTVSTIHNLGLVYRTLERLDEAEPLLREAVERHRRVRGLENPETLLAMGGLGEVYQAMGRLDEAEPLFVEVVEVAERTLGPDHFETGIHITLLAELQRARKQYDESERLHLRALEIFRGVHGDGHSSVLNSMDRLALVYRDAGRYEEAEPLYLRNLEANRRTFGDGHIQTLATLHNLADLYNRLERYPEAEPLAAEAVRGGREGLPAGHTAIGIFLSNHGESLTGIGEHAQAETVLLEAHQILTEAIGADDRRTRQATERLVALYRSWGRADEEAAWRERLEPVTVSADG